MLWSMMPATGLAMPWPFDQRFMQLALLAGIATGATAPLIGAFLVQKRLSLLGDGLGHLAFAGVALGLVSGVWPTWTALAVTVTGSVVLERLRSSGRLPGDLTLAVFFYTGIAAGVVLSSAAGSFNGSILTYLFGSIVTVSVSDLTVVLVLAGVIIVTMSLIGRALFAVVLDEEAARVNGLPVDALNMVLAVLAAVTIVVAMRVVGLLLVAALMVLPVAAASQLVASFRRTVLGAVLIGVCSAVIGLGLSRGMDTAPGGTVVLTVTALFLIAATIGAARGRTRIVRPEH